MARYRVLPWHGIPSQVRTTDETGSTVSHPLPASFQQGIDRVAMAEGLLDSDAYLEGWSRSEPAERDGPAVEVAEAIGHEVAAAWRTTDPGPDR